MSSNDIQDKDIVNNEDKITDDPIANSWWFTDFQNNWLKPIEITIVILLVFLVMRWITLSGYPVFGSLWVPMFMYMGRGMNAFFEKVNTSTLKMDDKGKFWSLFDPMHPVDPDSNLNPDAPPITGNIRVYAATNRFVRFWVAFLQVISSLVNGFIVYMFLPFRLMWSYLYYFKDSKYIAEHGLDGYYLITETPLNVWAEDGSVRGPNPNGPQIDAYGNSLNFMTTIKQRINWIATLGMDRTLYSNLHLLPIFRVSESRTGWVILLLVMYIFLSKAFTWTGVPETAEAARYGWYFVLVWIGVLGWAWWKGGFKLATTAFPPIKDFFMGEGDTWGEPSRFGDFFRTLLRNQYDRFDGSLPTEGPLSEGLIPPVIETPNNEQHAEMIGNSGEVIAEPERLVGGANNLNNILEQSINKIDEADKLLLPQVGIVPQEVLAAEEVYHKKVIPTVVYESRIMSDKRALEKEEKRLKAEHIEKTVASMPDPKSPEEQSKSIISFAEDIASAATQVNTNKPLTLNKTEIKESMKDVNESTIVSPVEKTEEKIPKKSIMSKFGNQFRDTMTSTRESMKESIAKAKKQTTDFIRRGGEMNDFPETVDEFEDSMQGGGRLRDVYEKSSRITPITWIPVPTTWMSGIPN